MKVSIEKTKDAF